jgi:hypothetical protein
MKYIKKFESEEINELKKYAIWYTIIDNTYEIIEIISRKFSSSGIQYKSKTIYVIIKNELVNPFSPEETFESPAIKDHIPYTSDNLQDCINKIEILSTLNKYNL